MSTPAAIVQAWGQSPVYSSFDLPPPAATQVRVKVLAAGFHNLVRGRAAGRHFTVAGKSPPHIPGTDGVGIIEGTQQLVYINCLTAPTGSFAQYVNAEKKDAFPLPEGADVENIAALVNGAMSSWMALTARVGIKPGSGEQFKVAIVGATGVSGQAAVQIAKALGATEVVTIGKPGAKLDKTKERGATATIPLATNLADTDFSAAADVDIVLDYLYGDVTTVALPGIVKLRKNKSQRLTWVEIGAIAGNEAPIPASLLRMANVAVLGCGPGSWTFPELGEQMPVLLKAISEYGVKTEYAVKNLKDIKTWWNEPSAARIVAKP